MPKYKSHLVKEEVQLGNGRVQPGRVVWEPVNDAAKVTTHAQAAMAEGKWTPADPKEIEKARARLEAAEERENRRRGIIN